MIARVEAEFTVPDVWGKHGGPALQRQSSSDRAAALVRRAIFDGRLRPGQRVPQDWVAEELGISRIPVREALIGLDREGWVRIEMHRGVFVNTLDESTVRDHYGLLGVIYCFAVRRATQRWDETADAHLRQIEAALSRSTESAEMYRLAIDFHAVIVAAARSPRVRSLLRAVPPVLPGDFFELVPGATKWQREALYDIAALIRSGDPEAASSRYQAMIEQNTEVVVEVFRSRGLFDPPAG